MRPTSIVVLMCCALSGSAFAQEAAPPGAPALVAPPAPQAAPAAPVGTEGQSTSAPGKEPLEVRVRRLLDDFDQRHQQRMLEISSYDKAGDAEPNVKRLANPRKVQVEIKDELDREQTSEALAREYSGEAVEVQKHEQAIQDFIAKQQKAMDDLSKRAGSVNRADLELAAENLARQPGTDAQVSEIRRRLAQAASAQRDLAAQQAQSKQEAASAEEELAKLRTLEQSLEKESKAYMADAASARQNQLHLSDRLEFYIVDAEAEDVIDQDTKAAEAAPHLAASPEVHNTLESLGPSAKADAKPDQKCAGTPSDAKGCPAAPPPAPKE